eukprot:s2152_g9.t1
METLPFDSPVVEAPCEAPTTSPPEQSSSDLKQTTPEIAPEATSKCPSNIQHEDKESQKVENQHGGKVDEALSPAHSGGPKSMAEPVPEESALSKKRVSEVEKELHKDSDQEPSKAKKQKAAEKEKPSIENAQAPDLLEIEAWYQQTSSRKCKFNQTPL